tara:strand:+ start:632 stop:1036 length:405 start_codon:yes stop_codon:yes gene_type:complete
VPVQQTSQGFKDISLSFKRHPITNDILPLKNEDAIKRSVQNLVRTRVGEVFFNPRIGTRISNALFELSTDDFTNPIKMEVESVITNFEPRVLLDKVTVNSRPDSNALDIVIRYLIIGLSAPPQNISFILEPTRL